MHTECHGIRILHRSYGFPHRAANAVGDRLCRRADVTRADVTDLRLEEQPLGVT